jgi:hypothetical protein
MMEQFLTRRLLIILFGGFLLTLGLLLYRNYSEVRNTLIASHNGFKRFLYLLYNTPKVEKRELTKGELNRIVQRLGITLKEFTRSGEKAIIKFDNVRAPQLAKLLFYLERYGEIEKFSAVDNTAKGNFYVEVYLNLLR